VPGLDELLQGSSVINSEFKFDLAEYLARHQNPPVRSLGEILDRGLYHAALESNFRARNAPEKKDTDQYRRALVKRTALRHALTAVLDEHRLVALVHPTLRRKPARIGDAQAGTTCQVSSHSGLPALGLPSGFTDDGLPVGMELLGREFSDGDLVALGFAIEQVLTPRRPPFSTPALVAGKAPAPTRIAISVGELLYDGTTAALSYRFDLERLTTNGATAVWIHRVENQKPAAALHQLFAGAGSSSAGSVVLSFGDRRALAEGRLILRIYDRKGRVIDEPITVPR
jgi:amidase